MKTTGISEFDLGDLVAGTRPSDQARPGREDPGFRARRRCRAHRRRRPPLPGRGLGRRGHLPRLRGHRGRRGHEGPGRAARLSPRTALRGAADPGARRLVAQLTPGDLDHVFFVSGGSEANESAFKFVRQYFLERGEPERWRIIGRWPSFHGNTLATLSAGWHVTRRKRNGPLLLPFPHVETPNCYRGCGHCRPGGACTLACARRARADPDRSRPRDGGGVHRRTGRRGRRRRPRAASRVLHDGPRDLRPLRRTAHRRRGDHGLRQAGQVVRGRALRGPAGHPRLRQGHRRGLCASRRLRRHASRCIEPFLAGSGRFEHNFTYAGHPVATAVGVAVLKILKRERLVERVAGLEVRISSTHFAPSSLTCRSSVTCGVWVFSPASSSCSDRATKKPFPAKASMATRAASLCMEEGVIVYPCSGGVDGESGDYLLLMPPYVTDRGRPATDGQSDSPGASPTGT